MERRYAHGWEVTLTHSEGVHAAAAHKPAVRICTQTPISQEPGDGKSREQQDEPDNAPLRGNLLGHHPSVRRFILQRSATKRGGL